MEPIKLTPQEGEPETIDFFELEGEMYTLPKDVPSPVVLDYLEHVGALGADRAASLAFTALLGRDALDKLRAANVPSSQLRQLFAALERHLLGALEGEGKARGGVGSRGASARSAG